MDAEHERRSGDDRREFALYYRYGSERRDNMERRRFEVAENDQPEPERVVTRTYWGASEEDSTPE